MDALEEDACAVVTAPAFTAECPNATRPSVRVDGEPRLPAGENRIRTSGPAAQRFADLRGVERRAPSERHHMGLAS